MIYKLFIEDGEYVDKITGEPRNLMEVEIAYTPEGINVGWDEFDSIEEAMTHYNIELKPIEDDTDTEGNI
jgi:hypothetical protein